jgi:hypothetical protein
MWRLVVFLCVLNATDVFAGTSRSAFRVGITITGNGNSPLLNPKPAAGPIAGPRTAIPLPPERRAAVGPRDNAPSSP